MDNLININLTTVARDGLISRQNTNLYRLPIKVMWVEGTSLYGPGFSRFFGITDKTSSSSFDSIYITNNNIIHSR